jgi:hypothetical protein
MAAADDDAVVLFTHQGTYANAPDALRLKQMFNEPIRNARTKSTLVFVRAISWINFRITSKRSLVKNRKDTYNRCL